MSTSQNGWPVDTSGAKQDRAALTRDVTVPNGVLAGDVAVVFRWLAQQFDTRVEPLVKGTCWGWFVKPIEGSSTISNHASGTAVDLNADQHPMGVAASKTFTAKQITACHAILAEAGGVLRWGGDYTGRPDPMHWEIVASPARVATLADKIRSEGEDDDMMIREGDSGEQVKFWQTCLTDLGYQVGDVDGSYGPHLAAAIAKFRTDHGATAQFAYTTGWTGWLLLREVAKKYAGKGTPGPQGPPGAAGAKGDPGPTGPAGALTGTLKVNGGQLSVATSA